MQQKVVGTIVIGGKPSEPRGTDGRDKQGGACDGLFLIFIQTEATHPFQANELGSIFKTEKYHGMQIGLQ